MDFSITYHHVRRIMHARIVFLFLFFQVFDHAVSAQQSNGRPDVQPLDTSTLYYRQSLLNKGVPALAVERILTQNNQLKSEGRNVSTFSLGRQYQPSPVTCARCQDLGVENGWSAWQSETGVNAQVQGLIMDPASAPAGPRFTITSGAGVDPLTPGLNPGDPAIPVVAPGFGSQSIRLGEPALAGMQGGCMDASNGISAGCAERLICPFTVNVLDTSFVYAYAFVMENPINAASPHTNENMPYIEFMILDQNGDTLPCAYQRYVANETFAGQYVANTVINGPDAPTYKPWTIEGVNLSGYTGQTLTIVITNADCQLAGHFAHSYWDFSCGTVSSLIRPNCNSNLPDTLIAPPSEPGNPYTYNWFKNNDPNPVGNTQIITPYTQNGDTFVVKVNTASGCNWYVSYIPQHYAITAGFSSTPACGSASFTDLSISPAANDPVSSWQWSFSGGSPAISSSSNPGAIVFPPGTSSVSLIVSTAGGCIDTFSQSVVIPPRPLAAFTIPDGCAGSVLQSVNSSSVSSGDVLTGSAWFIDGGTPSFSNLPQPAVSFSAPGSHAITLIVTNQSGCTDTATAQVTIAALPSASFSAPGVCLGEDVYTLNTSAIVPPGSPVSYSWSMPGATPANSAATSPVITYGNAGLHPVTLIATTSAGCSDTVIQNISVSGLPVAEFAVPPACTGTTITLQNLSSYPSVYPIRNYSWNMPGGSPASSTSFQPTVTFNQPDTVSISLMVSNADGCLDSVSHDIIIYAAPRVSFTVPPVCEGVPVTVSNTSTLQSPVTSMAYSWLATGAVPASSSVENPSFSFMRPGAKSLTLIATAQGGCSDSATVMVPVNGHPSAGFSTPVFCKGAPVTLVNQSRPPAGESIEDYIWSFSGAFPATSVAVNPVISFDSTGVYAIRLLVATPAGCVDSVVKSIEVHDKPVVLLPDHAEACVPFCHTFNNQSSTPDGTITSWQWSFPGGIPASSAEENPGQVCYDSPGTYAAGVTVTSSFGCSSSMNQGGAITAYSKPVASFVTDHQESTNLLPLIQFEDKSTADVVSWRWNFGDGAIESGIPKVTHDYSGSIPGNGFYHFDASLVVTTRYGCTDTALLPLDFSPSFSFFIPNAFTPNKDYRNGDFYGKGFGIKKYTIEVFDRWGLQLWSCHYEGSNIPWDMDGAEGMSSACRWDGTYQGARVEQDVYVWKVMLTDVFDKQHAYIGRVTVVY